MRRIIFYLSLSVFPGTQVYAQTAGEILDKANRAFSTYENLSMSVTAYLYATPSSPASLLGKGEMKKSEQNYYSHFLDNEMISNPNCTVIIDHEMKTMHCFSSDDKKGAKRSYMPDADSIAAQSDSLVYKGMVDGEQLVIAYNKNSIIEKIEFYISPSTSLLSKIEYYYAPPDEEYSADAWKMEVIYDKVSFDPPDKSAFSQDKFIEFKNKTWVPAEGYSNYHLTIVTPPKS